MANSTLSFFPSRSLIDPAPPTDELYVVSLSISEWGPSKSVGKSQVMTLDGTITGTLMYNTTQYSVTLVPKDQTHELMTMFFDSVMGFEKFYITRPMDDKLLTVQMMGEGSETLVDSGDLTAYAFSFNIRETTDDA